MLLSEILGIRFIKFLLLESDASASAGIYTITQSLTPLGWLVVIIFPIALIFGLIYLIAKTTKKPRLK